MTEKINNGGPAFPVYDHHADGQQFLAVTGMDLRDYFAAKAMAVVWAGIPDNVDRDLALSSLGRYSYEMADAMLKAREAA